jgi:hypothetical protein
MTTVTLNVQADNNSAMSIENNADLTLKDIDYVCGSNHVGYGVYLKGNKSTDPENMTTLNFESGSITTRDCSCVTTNGMDEPGSQINIKGGKLLNENSYGIYMPASGEMNISGGEVQGINMRRGTLNITGGKISKVSYSKEDADKIWDYVNYSGLIWLGDTVAILSGSNGYIKEEGEVLKVTKTGGTVEKSFGTDEPFTVYCLDTSDFNQVVEFEGVAREDIKIVTHEDIIEHKAYTPKSQTTIFVDGEQIFPVIEESSEETGE